MLLVLTHQPAMVRTARIWSSFVPCGDASQSRQPGESAVEA